MPKDKVSIEVEIKKIGEGLKIVQREMKDLGNQTKTESGKIRTSTDHIKSGFQSIKNAVSAIGPALLAVFGARALIRSMGNFIELSNRQEKSIAGLHQAMVSMGRYSPEYKNKILDIASAYQDLSTFGDEAIIEGTKFLMTYKEIGDDVMPRAIKVMMDLAALMGGDMRQAANMVGKAAMGMTGELRRAGVTVDENTYKARGFIGVLEQIEAQVGGQAQALRKTGWGGMEAFGNLLGDLKEDIGDLIKNALVPLAEEMIPVLKKAIVAFNDSAKELLPTIQNISRDVISATKFLLEHYEAIKKVVKIYLLLQNPLAGVEELWNKLTFSGDKVRGKIDDLIEATKKKRGAVIGLNKVLEEYLRKIGTIEDIEKRGKITAGAAPPAKMEETEPLMAIQKYLAYGWKEVGERVAREQRDLFETQIRLGKDLIDSEHLSAEEREAIWEQYKNARIKQINEEIKAMELAGVSSEMIAAYQKDALAELEKAHKKTTAEIGHIWEDLRGDLQWSLEAGFFDLFKGGLNDIGDAFKQFCNMLYESFARTVSKMITEWLIFEGITGAVSGISGLFGGGAPKTYVAQHGLMLTEPVLGSGLKTGSRYLFGEAGPEAVIPARNLGMRDVNLRVKVENKSSAPVEARADENVFYDSKMREIIVNVAIEDISHDGPLRKTIKRYL